MNLKIHKQPKMLNRTKSFSRADSMQVFFLALSSENNQTASENWFNKSEPISKVMIWTAKQQA